MIGFRLWQIAGWTMLHYFWVGAALGAAFGAVPLAGGLPGAGRGLALAVAQSREPPRNRQAISRSFGGGSQRLRASGHRTRLLRATYTSSYARTDLGAATAPDSSSANCGSPARPSGKRWASS